MAAPALAPDDPGTWTDAEPLECCAVVPEAPDVATISFVAPSGDRFPLASICSASRSVDLVELIGVGCPPRCASTTNR